MSISSIETKRRLDEMNKYDWKMGLLVTVVLLAVLISGFSSAANAATPKANTSGGVLKIAIRYDMPNFNYFDMSSNTVWKSDVIGWNFEGLMGIDYDGSAYPLLAERVDFDSNTLTATIHLRHNVTFHDGTPMTARDVIFSYCALRGDTTVSGTKFTIPFDDNNDGRVSFDEIQNHIKYVDNYTITISAKQPYNYFFRGTLGIPIIPEHVWKAHLVDSGDGQGTAVDEHGYTHGIIDTSWNNDPAATIGTGPWMYSGGVRDSYRVEKPYDGYWGKDFKTPDGYPRWNSNISEMIFKVYSNADNAILALQSGDVDYIAWSISPNTVAMLKEDPNIRLHYLPDKGYFYLAFNEKQEPVNYIAFRHAVSHVIDKQTAVQDYLGGFGQTGDSVEPPFFSAWYNASVQHYPYDINIARKILDGYKVVADNGFVEQDPAWNEVFKDVNGDGWRDLPDGSPMQPITLFTPPADYDPVRIKVGQEIAQNLRSVGVNIQAKPVDFDTLVAYMQSYNYVMLELGWLLSDDPVGNLADIFGTHSAQNNWGWWNASDPNPYYVNSGGVQNTRGDNMSQDYATLFDNVINKAMTTFNVDQQIKYTKWAQDIIAKATVVNVLYYRLNVIATRNSWSNWVEEGGTVFNTFSLGLLTPNNSWGNIKVHLLITMPNQMLVGDNVTAKVTVINGEGMILKNAEVNISTSSSAISIYPKSGKTDANGVFYFHIKGMSSDMGYINVTAQYNGSLGWNEELVNVYGVSALSARVYASKMSLSPGEESNLTVSVVDQDGNPVEGANVSVDTEVVGYGSVTPTSAITDSNGVATFTYHAPTAADMDGKYKNMHTIGKLVFHVSKSGYEYSNTPMLQLITYNDNPSDWHIYRVINASTYTVSPTIGYSTTIYVKAMQPDGTPLANEYIPVKYSDQSYIKDGPNAIETNATGIAKLTVTFNSGMDTKPIYIDFTNTSLLNVVSDRVDILYYDGYSMPSTELYGGLIQINTSFILEKNSKTPVKVYLYDKDGNPAGENSKIPLAVVVSGTTDGQLLNLFDYTNYNNSQSDPGKYNAWFNSAWYYTGIGIYTPYDNIATSGDFIGHANNTPNPYDGGLSTFDETGVVPGNLTNGSYTFYLQDAMSSYRDLRFNIYVIPYGDIYLYIANPNWDYYQFNITGMQVLHTQGVVSRAMKILIANMSADVAVKSNTHFNVTAKVLNESNSGVYNVKVKAYNNVKSWKAEFNPVYNTTNNDGIANLSPVAPKVSAPKEVYVYVKALGDTSTYSVIESTQILDIPNMAYFEDVKLNTSQIIWSNTTFSLSGRLMGPNGPIINDTVNLEINGTVVSGERTNATGYFNFNISGANYSGVTKISLMYSGGGYYPIQETIWVFITKGIVHVVHIDYPSIILVGSTGNITAVINSTFPLQSVTFFVEYGNNTTYEEYPMHRVGNTNIYYVYYPFSKAGNYTFYIVAKDLHGVSGTSNINSVQASSTVPEFTPELFLLLIPLFFIFFRRH